MFSISYIKQLGKTHNAILQQDCCCLSKLYIASRKLYTWMKVMIIYIKTHGSELRGQEEAGLRDKPVSYLQVAPL